ncbi:dolichyl pyrophosphate Man9GlcNAc2 alpha-1,3-glucosyltransferase-like [Ruditapes philippinarum]|uniref:dolichyl pyrophosphate Man9GlcNAc2 alpha-1,3-glucosyltransferase-like n=1 Tax=Ruditapes philippinarum TaxID=129788 RepID=UPI00295ABC61|nr:dolichyl pyrophosphate Man9GlcNAc2 alpha-1,3-glucosyltransferase-like [Ruditapes philippinarum]
MVGTCHKFVLASLLAVLVRWGVAQFGYSGAGMSPMYGDYEAQRHWQEVTVNLPVGEWYTNSSRNDLMYWGLDYPPLTAYHSKIVGLIAKVINPEWVALNSSRGYESYEHKLFMRFSVLFADLLVYFPAVMWIFTARKPNPKDSDSAVKSYLLMLMYPGLILIDYGHFQYNCISLGLALAAVTSLADSQDVLGSVLFCLSLNYKQMELYHAMPFFCFLLGSCLRNCKHGGIVQLIKIGLTVIVTFAVSWAPFLYSVDSVMQVVHRLFPFARGIFEDKVSNIWCSLSVVIKWKQVMTRDNILLLCLCSTCVCLLPSSLDLLFRPSFKKFRYALVNSSMVFFLFSFQVHEKSILLAALIVCTLIPDHPFWCFWFLQVSTFSMLPLLLKDGQLVPYLSLMCLYAILFYNFYPVENKNKEDQSETAVWINIFINLAFCISMVGVVILTLVMVLVPPPVHLPDLFSLVISVYSCAHFLLFTLFFHYCQFTTQMFPWKLADKSQNHVSSKSDTVHKSKASKPKIVKGKKKKQQ